MAETESNKRARVDSDDSPTESPESKRLRADLLGILDDVDATLDRDPATEDLATVMKSLEEEIALYLPEEAPPPPVLVSESDSSESQPDLGFLLGASDDELGLPPTSSSAENDKEEAEGLDILRGETEAVGFGQIWGFEDEIPSYDALEFGVRAEGEKKNEDGNFVFYELFDYQDVAASGPSDFAELSWRTETLPAL